MSTDTSSATDPISVVTPDQHSRQTTQTPGMDRLEVFATPDTWLGIVHTAPGVTSGWHHHGDYETFVYVQQGRVRMEFGPGGHDACEAKAGDFLRVPRGAVHRESNPGDEEQIGVIVRVGSGPPVFNVDGPAGSA
jgi:uncharacterized RmlC-like cupin family protein